MQTYVASIILDKQDRAALRDAKAFFGLSMTELLDLCLKQGIQWAQDMAATADMRAEERDDDDDEEADLVEAGREALARAYPAVPSGETVEVVLTLSKERADFALWLRQHVQLPDPSDAAKLRHFAQGVFELEVAKQAAMVEDGRHRHLTRDNFVAPGKRR